MSEQKIYNQTIPEWIATWRKRFANPAAHDKDTFWMEAEAIVDALDHRAPLPDVMGDGHVVIADGKGHELCVAIIDREPYWVRAYLGYKKEVISDDTAELFGLPDISKYHVPFGCLLAIFRGKTLEEPA